MLRKQKRKKAKTNNLKILTNPENKPKTTSFSGRIKRSFVIIVSAIGFTATLMTLYWNLTPSISVAPNTILENGSNATLTPFTFYNNGRFPIYNVKMSCAPNYIRCSGYDKTWIFTPNDNNYGAIFTYSDVFAKKVAAGGKYVEYIPLAEMGKSGLNPTEGDIAIIVSFNPVKYVPFFKYSRKFRFILAKSKDGSLVWVEEPFKN